MQSEGGILLHGNKGSSKSLFKSYDHIKAVKNINISICRGKVFGLLGANGAGKSTIIECISVPNKPDSGMVSILEMNV